MSVHVCLSFLFQYVDPNYSGNGYDEYFGDEPTGTLDCHSPDTEWELLGVYRQEFYQYIEQISKHLWAIDDYEYVVALAGLAYMTDADCFAVGSDSSGNTIYAGVAPQAEGKFQMALYTDTYCVTPNNNLGVTFDDYGLYSDIKLSSQDNGGGGDDDQYAYAQEWWEGAQEYTLELINDVYEDFKYCTSCVDYPTYQDGYFIGDDGTDDDDLINQCWKFYSHDSFTCEAACIAMAHSQGTILSIDYGGLSWGKALSGFYESTASANAQEEEEPVTFIESRWSRMLANAFVTASFILFVCTFLAFAVARRSRHKERSSGRSRRLLDGDGVSSSRRSRSQRSDGEGDGVFREENQRKSKRSIRSKSGSKRRSRKEPQTYDPPSRRRSRSQRHIDDF